MKAHIREVGVTIIDCLSDILSYIRIPLILLVSQLFLMSHLCQVIPHAQWELHSNEIIFFLRILVESFFLFPYGDFPQVGWQGISHQGISHLSLFLLGISHLFSYLWLFPICYWLLGNRFELLETNLPLPTAPQKCHRGRFVQGYVSIARIMSHRTRQQDVGIVPTYPK